MAGWRGVGFTFLFKNQTHLNGRFQSLDRNNEIGSSITVCSTFSSRTDRFIQLIDLDINFPTRPLSSARSCEVCRGLNGVEGVGGT